MKNLLIGILLINVCTAKPVSTNNHVNKAKDVCDTNIDIFTPNKTCAMCETIVKVIEYENKYINKSIDAIIKVIEIVCKNVLDPIGKKECLLIMNDTKKIVNWISNGLNSNQICKKIGLCKDIQIKDMIYTFNRNISCNTCLFITRIINKEAKFADVTINQLSIIIDDICHLINNNISNECLLIDTNIRNIVTWISNGLDNIQICEKIHLCNTSFN